MIRLSIDVGSQNTKIYMLGCGVVLSEATCVAVETSSNEGLKIKAFGDRAKALSGRAALNTRIINPVSEGRIINHDLLKYLLAYFLEKIEITPRKAKNTEVVFIIPCGVENSVKEDYKSIALECNIGRVYFTQTPYAAVVGSGVTLSETMPVLSLDVGYGVTNIAVFSLDGMISGVSLNLGGGNIDKHIMDLIAENHDLRIGTLTAERIKNTVGSFLEDDNKMLVVDGRNVLNGTPSSLAVNSSQIEDVLRLYVNKICEYVTIVISELPAEVASSVMHGGVYLSGGLMKLDGIAEYISKALNVPVNEWEEPSLASVIGGGTILADPVLCSSLTSID